MSREGAVGTDVQDAVPVLCALTDRLTEKTDCLLSERAWNLLNEQRAFHGVVKDAAGVGNPQLSREGGSSNPGTVQQHHGEVSTCAHSLKEHAAEEEAPAECSAVGPAATQSVVQECCGTDIVGQNRCSESLHENLQWRDKIKSEDASLVEMLAKDRRCADNRCTGGAGVEVSGKYWELLGSTPAVTSVGQHEIGPQKGFSPGKALESAQVVVEREGTSKSEKDQVVPSPRYCFRNSAGVGCCADDPGKLADSGEREAPTAEAQCRGMPGCGYEQGVLPRHAAVRGHLAELAGVRVPNGIPGYAVADRVSPRLRAALRETAASAMIDIEKPSWLCMYTGVRSLCWNLPAATSGTCHRRPRHVFQTGFLSDSGTDSAELVSDAHLAVRLQQGWELQRPHSTLTASSSSIRGGGVTVRRSLHISHFLYLMQLQAVEAWPGRLAGRLICLRTPNASAAESEELELLLLSEALAQASIIIALISTRSTLRLYIALRVNACFRRNT
ncbi:hypothetical protein HPB50_024693 [Hyalomma asiaticum]|uniref:Uncharacterized protein n=1 Tax=Hyalomma asiaticum TaxID=266040 RepID=A0ACB7TQS2_HYAAI|nr:hypothetical protein HPB50_024693 [Hyalomma asiaticum]